MRSLWKLSVLVPLVLWSQVFGMQGEFKRASPAYGFHIAEFIFNLNVEQHKEFALRTILLDDPCRLLDSTSFLQKLTEEQQHLFLKIVEQYNEDRWLDFKEKTLKYLPTVNTMTPEALKGLKLDQVCLQGLENSLSERIQALKATHEKIKIFARDLLEKSWCTILPQAQALCTSTLSLFEEDATIEIQESVCKGSQGLWAWATWGYASVKNWWYNEKFGPREQWWLINLGLLFATLKQEQHWLVPDVLEIFKGLKSIVLDQEYRHQVDMVIFKFSGSQRSLLITLCYQYLEVYVFKCLGENGYFKPHEDAAFRRSLSNQDNEYFMKLTSEQQNITGNIRQLAGLALAYIR